MKNFIKKLSQRQIGLIYIILALVLWFSPIIKIIPIKLLLIYFWFISPLITIFSILLFIAGIRKINNKNNIVIINSDKKINTIKRVLFVEPLLWIIIGLMSSTFIFWVGLFCHSEECKWIFAGFSFFVMIPSIIFGIFSIIFGLIRLNKYLKYKKSQNDILKN